MEKPVYIKFILRLTDPKFQDISGEKRHLQYVGNKMAANRRLFRYLLFPKLYFKLWFYLGYLQKYPDTFPQYDQIPQMGRPVQMLLNSTTLKVDYYAGEYTFPLNNLQIRRQKNALIIETTEGGKFFIPRRGVKTNSDWKNICGILLTAAPHLTDE